MANDVTVTRLEEGVYLASRPLGRGEPDVRAALLLGQHRSAVVDTMLCPEDMAPLLTLLARHGRPVVVVNTHADWDHVWGNAAFPAASIAGHIVCRERLAGAEERAVLDAKRGEDPALFANVALVLPDVTFDQFMAFDLGGLTLELHHVPGHTADCLVAYVPERRLLYAGDCAEDPWPLLHSGPLDRWIGALRYWAARDVATVVPSHGRISGVELLLNNASYLESLPDGGLPSGTRPDGVPPFYIAGHEENCAAARLLGAA